MGRRAFETRIRYAKDYMGMGEGYLFETDIHDGHGFCMDSFFGIVDDRLHYTALTKIQELMRYGNTITWGPEWVAEEEQPAAAAQ